jgi:hypothetical protein
MGGMNRPIGVIVLAVLAIMAGVLYLFEGFRLMNIVTFGPIPSGNGVWLSGLFTVIVGVIWLAVGFALWSLQPWGLLFVEIMAIFGLVNAVFILFATGSLQDGIGAAILPAIVLWYANRESVRAHFAQSMPA